MKRLFLILLAVVPLTITAAPTQPATMFTWSAPTQNTDVKTVADPAATSQVFNYLADGTWYCAITAYNTSKVESGYSNEINFPVKAGISPIISPVAPGSFGIK